MTDFDPARLASMDAKEFTKLVKSTPDSTINEVMQSDLRGPILDEAFGRMPSLFRPEKAGSTSAVIHWNITGRPDGGTDTYEIVIDNGTCQVTSTPEREPRLTLTLAPLDFVKVISGSANPMMMFMTGKLKAKGDLGLAANIANLFDIPKG
ncbi:SCP2 sterol-binding domain-containing protein [Solwaraspora sp. WMMD406]|uniref:SCP2 sterol-binding domain-containing protein n=1 Tax=Solwaraspora sp. WMMD406 TaxID=3016095 RepID=UPI002417CEA9|nr:SCP2 sterol-binding domain-containing protein [Solwaraspora sp. WMMD406]MDG4762850.1 SCP2 sterol-binding domain-containing protein [Solwaraspora sp. WMMD406]